ncbi:Sec-independent protein translocase protein TatB [Frankia sp. Cas3]|uniref:Sec-independent protein translocase protein TatB n=1 Tax=Frankia sp. Cas3 TaxID=3073926 RepID=UPI002AD1E795|nr:Sec-independent protein translocase protein TatB [Frankia sp. Cas3]
MFNGVGWGEVAVLLLIGLFVFGPERLPNAARDAGRMLRQFRQMAAGMREELRSELGPEIADLDLSTLHPTTFVRKHLFEDEDPLLPSYLSKRTSLDKMLFDDDPETPSGPTEPVRPRLSYDDAPAVAKAPSLTKSPALTKSPILTKATSTPAKAAPTDRGQAAAAAPAARGAVSAEMLSAATPFDTDAT